MNLSQRKCISLQRFVGQKDLLCWASSVAWLSVTPDQTNLFVLCLYSFFLYSFFFLLLPFFPLCILFLLLSFHGSLKNTLFSCICFLMSCPTSHKFKHRLGTNFALLNLQKEKLCSSINIDIYGYINVYFRFQNVFIYGIHLYLIICQVLSLVTEI